MSPSLKTLSGETQRIATEVLSHAELLAAVVLYKTQRNDAREENAKLRTALASLLTAVDSPAGDEIREWQDGNVLEARAALAPKG